MQLPRAASLLMAPIPIGVVQQAARHAFATVMARHPALFDRLGEHAQRTFVFAPTDLPFAFAVTPADGGIRVARPGVFVSADATVSGPLVLLLALLEGRVDGDATFFSRELEVTGDMEAIVALRNAVDDSRIDLPSDLAPLAGPLAEPLRLTLERVRTLLLERRQRAWN